MAILKKKKPPEKLNICLITKKFPYPGRGSDDSYLWPIARGLAKEGHDVVVLSWQNPRGKAEVSSGSVQAFFLGENKTVSKEHFSFLVLRKFRELHDKKPFHIIHSLDESAIEIGRERKKFGVLVTYDVSATQLSQLFSILAMAQDTIGSLLSTGTALMYKFTTTYFRFDRKLLKTADAVFVATPLQKIMLERYYLYPELKIFIVPYGMDYIETDIIAPNEKLKKELSLPVHGQNILTYSDMTEFEEIANLLNAFQKVVVKKPNSRLIILGNGPLRKEIEFEMLNLALGSKVIFTGSIGNDKLHDYVALSDVYVNLSSRTTGFEPLMLSAMAQGKVVIGSELSPISTIITDGENGFLVRPADIKGLTDLITALFTDGFRSRMVNLSVEEIGVKAREKVLDLFNIDKMVYQMLDAFYKTVRRTGRKFSEIPRNSPNTKSDLDQNQNL